MKEDRGRRDRHAHLQRPAREHAPDDAPEPLERELDPDAEEEERHAELGELPDRLGVRDDPEPARPDQHPGDQVGDDRGQPERAPGDERRGRDRQKRDDVEEHGAPILATTFALAARPARPYSAR